MGKRCLVFFFQAEDGIRDLVRSRGLGDVYKRQEVADMPSSYTDFAWRRIQARERMTTTGDACFVGALSLIHI